MKKLSLDVNTHYRQGHVGIENVITGLAGQRLGVASRCVKVYLEWYLVKCTTLALAKKVLTILAKPGIYCFLVINNCHCLIVYFANVLFFHEKQNRCHNLTI